MFLSRLAKEHSHPIIAGPRQGSPIPMEIGEAEENHAEIMRPKRFFFHRQHDEWYSWRDLFPTTTTSPNMATSALQAW